MGSLVNRMDNQIETLDSRNINLNDYQSKISDTDVAREVTELTSAQVKQQAAMSMLAQSNSRLSRIMEILS
jgi:flagellin